MHYSEKIDASIAKILESKAYVSISGLNLEEIERIQSHGVLACKLPESYKYFLSIAGKYVGSWFLGARFFYPEFLVNRGVFFDYFIEMVALKEIRLKDYLTEYGSNNFIFWMDLDGGRALCFDVDYSRKNNIEDPPVYWLTPGKPQENTSFSSWMLDWVYPT